MNQAQPNHEPEKAILVSGDYEEYLNWTKEKRQQKIIEIQDLIEDPNQSNEYKSSLWFEIGNLQFVWKRV